MKPKFHDFKDEKFESMMWYDLNDWNVKNKKYGND